MCGCNGSPKVTDDVFIGDEQFNACCSRCHGDDAVGGAYAAPDLRHSLEGGMTCQEFIETVMAGRESKGMPSWAGMSAPEQMRGLNECMQARSLGRVPQGRPASAHD
ncbi:MAG: c-type cytochrome [Burkholderiales bacterium]|nr:c-type cytochrome [Burkholderiales bacterium]MDE2454410.1 c-type cytochrome [Burkholderiales bacterium]